MTAARHTSCRRERAVRRAGDVSYSGERPAHDDRGVVLPGKRTSRRARDVLLRGKRALHRDEPIAMLQSHPTPDLAARGKSQAALRADLFRHLCVAESAKYDRNDCGSAASPEPEPEAVAPEPESPPPGPAPVTPVPEPAPPAEDAASALGDWCQSQPQARARDFSSDQGAKPQSYWSISRISQRRAGGKDPLAARLDFCHGLLKR